MHRCTTISTEDQTQPLYHLVARQMRSMMVKLYTFLCAFDKGSRTLHAFITSPFRRLIDDSLFPGIGKLLYK